MELHPLCTFFPRMSDEEFSSLKVSLQNNGQTHPIFTLGGMILDGGNRYRALCELGIEPIMVEYQGPSPTQFILSSNLHRRHLTQGQSAAIVSASQGWINAQPESQTPNHLSLDTAAARAKQSGVGQRTQQLADKLVKEAPVDLVNEVINGKKSLNKAIKEITPPKPVVPKSTDIVVESENNVDPILSTFEPQQPLINSVNNHVGVVTDEDGDTGLNSLDGIQRLTELNKALNARIIELTLEKDEAVKSASYWKEQYLVLEASLNKDRVE
jgi:hypothetical protein